MLGKLAGALIGSKVAEKEGGAGGAVLGTGVAAIGRRGLMPLLATLAVAWGVRKLYRERARFMPQ
jgi:hypothetical protein